MTAGGARTAVKPPTCAMGQPALRQLLATIYYGPMKLFWCAALSAVTLAAQTFPGARALDDAINQGIEQGKLPGAVVIVGHNGQVVYRKAYGKRALIPQPEAMTVDTV